MGRLWCSAVTGSGTYDDFARFYDDTFTDRASQAEDAVAAQWLQARVARDAAVLDVGCGTGWLLDHLRVDRDHYLGFDLSQGMLAEAKRKHPAVDLALWDMNDQWPSGRWDVVAATFAAPNYAESVQDFLTQAWRSLNPGGRLLLMPWAPGELSRVDTYMPEGLYHGSVPWSAEVARDRLGQAGFEVQEIRGLRWHRLHPPSWLPERAHEAWLSIESMTLGRVTPNVCNFLLIEAVAT